MNKIIYKLGLISSSILILYALYGSIFVKGKTLFKGKTLISLFMAVIVIMFTIAFIVLLYFQMRKFKPKNFLIIASGLALIIRVFSLIVLDSKPISDYAFFYKNAVRFAHGDFMSYDRTYLLFPHKFGYPLVLSIVYRVFGNSIFTGKMFNVIISIGIMICIYFCTKKIFDEPSARLACIIFIFYPSQIMYNSVLATENVFTLFFMSALLLFFNYKNYLYKFKGYIILLAIGVFIAFANFIRPVAPILLVAIGIYLLIFVYTKGGFRQNLLRKVIAISVITVSYLLTFYSISRFVLIKTNVNILESCPEYSVMVGTDWRFGGFYNREAQKVVESGQYNIDKVKILAKKEIKKNISTNNNKLKFFMHDKYFSMWSDDTYGYNWSMKKVYKKNIINDFTLKHPTLFYIFIQSYYNIILLISAIGFLLLYFKGEATEAILVPIIFIGFVISHTILEIQPRYHYPVSILLIIIGGFGLQFILKNKICS